MAREVLVDTGGLCILLSTVLTLGVLSLVPVRAGLAPEHEAQAAELRQQALDSAEAYRTLESLCVEVGPRLVGTPGDARAVAWAERKLEESGFDKIWREPVATSGWERGPASLDVLTPYPQGLCITALGGSVATPKNGIGGQVIRFDNVKALEAAERPRVEGRIVFIDMPMTATRDGSGYGVAVRGRTNGAASAAKLGASAVLIRSIGTDNSRLPHTGNLQYREAIPKIPAAALAIADANQLAAMLKRGEVEVLLRLQTRDLGAVTSHNVIGEIRGSVRAEELVLLSHGK